MSLLGFGTGGPTTFTEAELSDADKTRLLHRCLDRGINLIDTSQGYGDSELFLGAALAGVPRDRYLLSTKWAYSRWTGPDSDPKEGELIGDPGAFERAVDASLRRLRTDYVDVMFVHGLKPEDYDAVYERHGAAIERLKQAGKIRLVGFSERIAAWKADGSLAPDAVADDDPLGWLVRGEVESVVSAGMKFAADHPGVSTVLTGTRSFDHLEANIRALEEPRLLDADHDRLVCLFSFAREWR